MIFLHVFLETILCGVRNSTKLAKNGGGRMLLAVTEHGAPGKWAHIRNGAKARVRHIVRFL